MTLTGFQASGKSTIAKAQAFGVVPADGLEDEFDVYCGSDLKETLENRLGEKFLRTFGSVWSMPDEMYMEYHFTDTCFLKISLKKDRKYIASNYILATFSPDLNDFLQKHNNSLIATPLGVANESLRTFKEDLYKLFNDHYSVVYIPAGRSMITLLSQQFGYIYATMGDVQKRSLDSCTRDYLERILRGAYRYSNGEEQIVLDNGKYVKINFSSSGQQECVWILNLLYYYMLQQNKILFIIEEPESHLFPESQKYIAELIALVNNCGHSIVLTTHSPYVLGTLNNLLYAKTILSKYSEKINRVIPESFWLDCNHFGSWFVKKWDN